jgi:hypothetical protein
MSQDEFDYVIVTGAVNGRLRAGSPVELKNQANRVCPLEAGILRATR